MATYYTCGKCGKLTEVGDDNGWLIAQRKGEKTGPATFVLDRRGTEDVAHAIGAEARANVLFTNFSNQPSLDDLAWYASEGWLAAVEQGDTHDQHRTSGS